MLTAEQVATSPEPVAPPTGRVRLVATLLSALATALALAFPFLPVEQDTTVLTWPAAGGDTADIRAPLVALRPLALNAFVPCAALRDLDARGPATVLATTPPGAPDAAAVGMRITVAGGVLTVDLHGERFAEAPLPLSCDLQLRSTAGSTEVVLGGAVLATAQDDRRPQVTGVFSDLDDGRDAVAGTAVRIEVDNRFDSVASLPKASAGVLAVLALLGALVLLRWDDDAHGRRPPPRARRRPNARDGAVAGVLSLWVVVGTATVDDGYILTMVRASWSSGWIGNHYRWFGVPEAPFGWFYELYAVWARIDDSVLWLRLPGLVMGLAAWWMLSRWWLPRLGPAVCGSLSAAWTAAVAFLCAWLPFGNGLRPEPVVVLGLLLSLAGVERALALRRLLPLAGALLAAAFAVAATPTGLLAAAPLLAAAGPLARLLRSRPAALAPLSAAGTVVLIAVFADQTWAAVAEATRIRSAIGPYVPWYGELYRYSLLFAPTADGSLARRFPVLLLVTAGIGAVLLLVAGRAWGVARGPARRLLVVAALGFVVLALTPTKWTHHFGAFAALVPAVAALAVGVATARPRLALLAGVLAGSALAFQGPNAWWYVSNWGVPWFDRPPAPAGVTVSSLLLLAALGCGVLAVFGPRPATVHRAAGVGVAVLCAFVVILEVGTPVRAAFAQSGSYAMATDVLEDPTGSGCGLSDHVLVELDPTAGALRLQLGPAPVLEGFAPGTPTVTEPDPAVTAPGAAVGSSWSSASGPGTGELRSAWYALPDDPAALAAAPLVVGVAGQLGGGTAVTVELGTGSGSDVRVLDRIDAATLPSVSAEADSDGTGSAGPGWRDVRVDLRDAGGADLVRLVATDRALGEDAWVAVTPPRVPRLVSLLDVVSGSGHLDWPVAFPHPCLRPFSVDNGVAELPTYRVLADPQQRGVGEDWSAPSAGGPLGWIELTAHQRVIPTYLEGQWSRDWGQLRLLEPWASGAGAPQVERETAVEWGATYPGPVGSPPNR